jgi:hypothetical protein
MTININDVRLPGWNPQVMHYGDGFYVNFNFNCDNFLFTNYSFSIDALWRDNDGDHIHNIHGSLEAMAMLPYMSKTKSLECDATYGCGGLYCGGGFDFPDVERPPRDWPVYLYLTVSNLYTQEVKTIHIGSTFTPPILEGFPQISVEQFPAEILVSQLSYLDAGVVAYGGAVTNPSFGMKLVSGPAPKFWYGGGWRTLTSEYTYWPAITSVISQGTEAKTTITFTLPSEGNKTMVIEFIAARIDSNGNPAIYGTPLQRSTYLKTNIVAQCQDGAQRCATADGSPGGCQKQICNNNTWFVQNSNDITCPGCNFNAPCGTTPHNTLGCGHPDICTQYKCDNGNWEVYQSISGNCGTNCATCPEEDATYCDGCKQYQCSGGKWLLADGNSPECGSNCGSGSANTLIYIGAAVAAIGAVGAFYIYRTRKNKQMKE